ncbi:ATP-binding protein [Jiella sp. M17.18]|uniref:sensor histidine kinase n=1 Tax=Jiella sp. M17.18 TaxID=3234247 RepID=UPI0034DFEC99
MRLPEHLRSTSFRLAAVYAVLFVVSVLVIMGTTYVAATAEMQSIIRSSVTQDLDAFRAAFQTGGAVALRNSVQDRSENAADDRFYLLIGPQDAVLSGDLPRAAWIEGWADRKLSGRIVDASPDLKQAAAQNSDHEVRLFSQGEVMGGLKVMAGRNSHILDETQEIMVSALLWGGLATTLLALVGGYLVSIGPTRRVDAIAATTRHIVSGRLDLRLPVSGRRDELDRLAADINEMLARIEGLMENLKQVSTDIAHDLRTPLARLRQGLEAVRVRPSGMAALEAAIDGAVAETDAIIATFNALLRISQIEAGARRERFGPVDLSALAERLVDVYGEVAADEGHRLDAQIRPGIRVEGDADLLTQMIANLLENAINHVPAPGRITLGLGTDEGTPVLDVADDGPGIPEAERKKVFRRLYRLDRSRTTPGSGLGLALVAAIAELHGATVTALDNAPGLRMRVTFAPPIRQAPTRAPGDYETV